jgi:amidase
MARERITPEDGHVYEFAPEMEPVYTAADGESLTVETVDSLEGTIQSDEDLLDSIPEEVNAATGPIAVEGVDPGDLLAVEIEAVRLAEDRGRVVTTPGFGLLQDHDDVEHPFTRTTAVDEAAGTIDFQGTAVPIDPVIGTIGVATETEPVPTLTPGPHGGNLDTTDVTAGTTAYFPVFQEGAMLAMGDAKAAMADGEMCGTGAEIAVEIDLTVSVVSEPPVATGRPLLATDDAVTTLASAETLDEAVELAHRDLVDLLAAVEGYATTEAYTFASLVGGLEVSQVVDPLVTARNAIPGEYLDLPY